MVKETEKERKQHSTVACFLNSAGTDSMFDYNNGQAFFPVFFSVQGVSVLSGWRHVLLERLRWRRFIWW